jgi:methylglyoxal synthase
MLLKISTATTVTIGPVLDADGAAVTTAVVTNFSLVKNGSSAALTTETLTHVANGYYTLALTSGNTDALGNLEVFVNNTAMSMTVFRYNVIAAQVYDSIVSGTDLLQTDVREMLADVITSSTLATSAVDEIADGVWDEPYNQHTTAGTFGKLMDILRKSNLTIEGTVSSAITPTTVTFSSNVSATTSAYAHAVLLFVSGPLTGENSPIISYNNTNGVFVLEEPLTAAPSDGDEFVVIAGSHVHAIADIQSGLATSSQAVAIKAVTDKLDTAVVLDGAVYQFTANALELGPSGSATVVVSPLSATQPEAVIGTRIPRAVGDVSPIAVDIYDSTGAAVNLTTLGDLEVCVETEANVDLQVVAHANLTISGTSNNKVTWTPNAASVATVAKHRWSLRVASNKKDIAHGVFEVLRVALSDV